MSRCRSVFSFSCKWDDADEKNGNSLWKNPLFSLPVCPCVCAVCETAKNTGFSLLTIHSLSLIRLTAEQPAAACVCDSSRCSFFFFHTVYEFDAAAAEPHLPLFSLLFCRIYICSYSLCVLLVQCSSTQASRRSRLRLL